MSKLEGQAAQLAMRYRFILALLLATASGAEPRPTEVDATITTVVSTGYHRFLEYRLCSPEHCWSSAYLQWYGNNSPQISIVETTAIIEISYGNAVKSAKWVWIDEKPQLEILVIPSHGGFEPYVLTVVPGMPGEYTVKKT